MPRKAAQGTGTIRKKTVTRKGKDYAYWEARYTAGVDPGTGKQIQRSITGKTQKEVAQKLKAATAAIDQGTYIAPSKMTVSTWMDIWAQDYLGGVKPRTLDNYKTVIKNHIKPALGAIRMEALDTHTIQSFYNALGRPNGSKLGLSPKSIKNVHGVLHSAIQQAVSMGYLRFNASDSCTLPRKERAELKPLDEAQISAFLSAIKGHPLETLFITALFTGMREGELLGLQWKAIDFQTGTIAVISQLQKLVGEAPKLVSPKNSKGRTISPAKSVMALLKAHRAKQAAQRLKVGALWEDSGLVFTNELGQPLVKISVYRAFKKVAAAIGRPDARFHDLRHSYAVAAIRSGDDIKTVQGNLGHATAAFTLDVYGHVTDQMKQESAARMEAFIKTVSSQ